MKTLLIPLSLLLTALLLLPGCTSDQPPFTQAEFDRFLTDARTVSVLSNQAEERYLDDHNRRPGPKMKGIIGQKAELSGWDPDRYLYIYEHCVLYGAYVDLEDEVARISDAMAEGHKYDKSIPAPEAFPLTVSLKRQAAVLKKRYEQAVPVSEQVLIHERRKDVMNITRKSDLMAAR